MIEYFNIAKEEHRALMCDGTILLGYRGSIAHGMFIPSTDPKSIDDVDLMGIAVGNKSNYLGLQGWNSRGTKELKEGQWDIVTYEIKKMFSLLLQGNPNVISMLWLRDEYYVMLPDLGRNILNNKALFDGKHVYNAFAGYAHQQLVKMESRDPADLRMYLALTYEAKHRAIHPNEKGNHVSYPKDYDVTCGESKNAMAMKDDRLLANLHSYMKKGDNLGYLGDKRKGLILEHGYDAKNAAHCVRLLRMAGEYLRTGQMNVFRNDAAELLDIKRGKWTLPQIKAHAEELFKDMEAARDNSPLPEKPNKEKAEKLLIEVIEDYLYA